MIQTPRLRFRPWRAEHRAAFAQMHADPEVMAGQGGPTDQIKSDETFDRYRAAYLEHGVSRWAVENAGGTFPGYAGVKEIASCSGADNLRSQAVMTRLKFQCDPSRDFVAEYESVGLRRGLVWVAFPAQSRTQP